MKQASWQVPKVNSFPPLQQLFKLKSFSSLHLFIIICFFPPFVKTIDFFFRKCSKGEGGGYKVATEGKPFFFSSGCQPSSGRLRAPRAPHRFAPTGVFPPVISGSTVLAFIIMGATRHKSPDPGSIAASASCLSFGQNKKLRLSQPAVSTQKEKKCSSDRGPGGAGEGVNKKMSDSLGPRLSQHQKWTRLRQNVAAEKCRFSLFLFWRKEIILDDFSLIF
jgi:hypothetical protein